MVKGVSRRIVVVRAPEQRLFEEAIFILRDDAMHKGVTEDDIVRRPAASRPAISGRTAKAARGACGSWRRCGRWEPAWPRRPSSCGS